jgi:[methyl-Co(III) methanol-specific corrinoid protein]:coenzyme M methyltransferase
MPVLTPRERVLRLFRKAPIDTMPCFSGMGMVTLDAIRKIGIPFAKVHTTGENLARSAMATAELFGFDSVVVPYDMCTVAEAMGRGASLYEDSSEILYPTVPNKWASLEDVQIPDDLLLRGRMPAVDRAFGILNEARADGRFAVGAWLLGPFTFAGQIVELDLLLKGVKKDKERVEAFLTRITDLTIRLGRHYQQLGADYLSIREMGTGTDLLSPRMWKTLIQPNLQRVFGALESPKVLHICGATDLLIGMMNECGADALSVDQKNNVAESRQKLGSDVLLLGNFSPYATLCEMGAAEVEGVIRKCIDDGVDAVWPGCDIWPEARKENVEAYVRTVRQHGARPSPAVGRL